MIAALRSALRLRLDYVRLAYRTSRPLTLLTACTLVLGAAIPLANVGIIGVVVGRIPQAVHDGPDSAATSSALRWTVVAGLLVALQFLVGGLQTTITTSLGNRLDLALQRRLMTSVMRPVGISHLERPEVAHLVAIGGETFRPWLKPGRAVAALCALATARVGQLGGCLLLAVLNPVFAVLLLAASLWAQYEIQKVSKRETAHHLGANRLARRQDYFYDLGLTPAAAKEVRVFGLAGFLESRFAQSWRQSARFLFSGGQPRSWAATAALAVVALGGLGRLTAQALDGDVAIGWASAYAQATIMACAMVGASVVAGTQSALALDTFARFRASFDALDQAESVEAVDPVLRQSDRTRAAAAAGAGDPPAPHLPRHQIRFENVRFRYPDTTRDVLDGLDLTLPAGRSLAVVGANGAGKTTLVKLLCRLYEPTQGRITVDGLPLRDLDPVAWQRGIAPVFQDYLRYHLPARNNVGLGAPAYQDDLEGIRAAAGSAMIADRIDGLPKGWDTVLSAGYPDGADLSGGEWQRVALARALFSVRHGARILVLDEPAANLDARAEAELYEHFLAITEGITTVVISHRFSTVRQASSIVVLSGGRVSEQGTHAELMERDGEYARMFRLQAERFGGVTAT